MILWPTTVVGASLYGKSRFKEGRTGKNTQHTVIALFRQSAFGRPARGLQNHPCEIQSRTSGPWWSQANVICGILKDTAMAIRTWIIWMALVGWTTAAYGAEVADLPVEAAANRPAYSLKLGSANAAVIDPGVKQYLGKCVSSTAQHIQEKDDHVVLAKKGNNDTDGVFEFVIDPPIKPGAYFVWVKFGLGSTRPQKFEIKTGPGAASLRAAGALSLANPAGWKRQWLTANRQVTINPGDKIIQIKAAGIADEGKYFDGFVLCDP